MKLYINEIETAVPEFAVTQPEAFEHFKRYFDLSESERRWYKKLFTESPIKKRHVGLEIAEDIARVNQDDLIRRFKKQARKVAGAAARRCLAAGSLAPEELERLTVNTCTGYLCPGLTSYLVEDLGLKKTIYLCDLMGMGCGAAIPNLQTTGDFVRTHAGKPALAVQTEICTATFYRGEDPALMVSNAIFGDGAAAVLLSGKKGRLEIKDYESLLLPAERKKLMYKTENNRLRNVLSRDVPEIGARACRRVVDRLLDKNDLSRSEVKHWAVHPGGTSVLEEIEKKLSLKDGELSYSHKVFENYGNMSSATVVFVLKEILENEPLRPGERLVMTSFGAGFSAHACLLEVPGGGTPGSSPFSN